MNKEEVRFLVKEAVKETLKGIGITVDNPHETQADFYYIRKLRKSHEFIGRRIFISIIAFFVPSILYIFWENLKDIIKK